jgi:hypothetical protein
MATLLHKYEDGEYKTAWFDPIDVSTNIKHGGWFASKEEALPAPEVEEKEVQEDLVIIDAQEFEKEAETIVDVGPEEETTLELKKLDLDTFENDDIRELARSAGIKRWKSKRIKTLKLEIEAIRNGD